MLSVASSSHAYRERVDGVRDHGRAGVRGGVEEYEEEVLVQEGAPEPPATDFANTPPAQGKPRCITLIFEWLMNIYMMHIYVTGILWKLHA